MIPALIRTIAAAAAMHCTDITLVMVASLNFSGDSHEKCKDRFDLLIPCPSIKLHISTSKARYLNGLSSVERLKLSYLRKVETSSRITKIKQ